jgi:hypothetical protein
VTVGSNRIGDVQGQNTIVQIAGNDVHLTCANELANELAELAHEMMREGTPSYPIGEIQNAETSIRKGDSNTALQHLKSAGSWALERADKIGLELASSAIKSALGL